MRRKIMPKLRFIPLFMIVFAFFVLLGNSRPQNPGREWVQNHPFQISAAAMSDTYWGVKTYRDCGLNAIHPWQLLPDHPHGNTVIFNSSRDDGLIVHPDIRGTHLHDGLLNFINSISDTSSTHAWYVMDEPPQEIFPGVAEVVLWLKENRPDSLIYLSTANFADEYLDPLMSQMEPDALAYCFYPFYSGATEINKYFNATTRMRNKTLQHNIPMFTWIHAFAGVSGSDNWRIPTEGDIRMQVFSSLAAGTKGLFYWLYDRDQWAVDFTYAMTDIGGTPNEMYYQIQGINSEVAKLGEVLRFLKSEDLRFVRGRRNIYQMNSVPTGLTEWSFGAGGNTKITGVAVAPGQNGDEKNGLIGFFSYDGPDVQCDGAQYFMFTNLHRSDTLNFTITFDPSVSGLRKLSRATGNWEKVDILNGILDLTLSAGTGELFDFSECYAEQEENDDDVEDDTDNNYDEDTHDIPDDDISENDEEKYPDENSDSDKDVTEDDSSYIENGDSSDKDNDDGEDRYDRGTEGVLDETGCGCSVIY